MARLFAIVALGSVGLLVALRRQHSLHLIDGIAQRAESTKWAAQMSHNAAPG